MSHEPAPVHAYYPLLAEGARFDHVCIAGPSLRPLLTTYVGALGGEFLWGEVLPGRAVVVTVGYPGGGHVELMAPTPGSTFLESFLARTGGVGGLHHVTWIVPDVRAAVVALEAAGHRLVGQLLDDPAWSEAFVHPSTGGVLLQVATPGPAVADSLLHDLDLVLAASEGTTG